MKGKLTSSLAQKNTSLQGHQVRFVDGRSDFVKGTFRWGYCCGEMKKAQQGEKEWNFHDGEELLKECVFVG